MLYDNRNFITMDNKYTPLVWFLNDEPINYNEILKTQSAYFEAIEGIEEEHRNIIENGID